ncbi:hypothetical protein NDS46_31395 (plasmid) [Paenibacillus thiaminolyticus]|uniref:hypothetical protein n=1 Tax=Paenibacillus thiaminolyticus TaxID=49283 RepID=UPI00232D646C|nr:hypothetical protein [Paenibacillus thiaminolyticus]WCF11464.1 hypothetical protein NDS46_31395 [Paenibacillus thiaminolyticus]
MKYEDGKIVSIEVEQNQKFRPIEHSPGEQENIPKEPRSIQLKGLIRKNLNYVKLAGFILVLLFLALALFDVYKAFFVIDRTSQSISDSNDIENASDKEQRTDDNSNNHQKEDLKTVEVDDIHQVESNDNSLGHLLEFINHINEKMVKISIEEIDYINRYHDKQANKVGLQKFLMKCQSEKEELYNSSTTFKSLFVDGGDGLEEFYDASMDRLLASTQFTKDLYLSIDAPTSNTHSLIDEYEKTDKNLQLEQQVKLVNVLKKKNITYAINEITKEVQYTISK